jgi:cytochrome c553
LCHAADAAQGDPQAGREKAQVCASCHGERGISAMPGVPSLAGQTDQFIQWQLVFFRSGRRENPLMSPIAADLTDEDVRNLGAYFASLPRNADPAKADPEPDADLRSKGQAIAHQYHCAVCHMDNFLGKQAAALIANQRADYLVKALADYRAAARPSVGVAAMTEAASGLSDDEIAALAHFLAAL